MVFWNVGKFRMRRRLTLSHTEATQDIAVDGWALTMLRKEMAGWDMVMG